MHYNSHCNLLYIFINNHKGYSLKVHDIWWRSCVLMGGYCTLGYNQVFLNKYEKKNGCIYDCIIIALIIIMLHNSGYNYLQKHYIYSIDMYSIVYRHDVVCFFSLCFTVISCLFVLFCCISFCFYFIFHCLFYFFVIELCSLFFVCYFIFIQFKFSMFLFILFVFYFIYF